MFERRAVDELLHERVQAAKHHLTAIGVRLSALVSPDNSASAQLTDVVLPRRLRTVRET